MKKAKNCEKDVNKKLGEAIKIIQSISFDELTKCELVNIKDAAKKSDDFNKKLEIVCKYKEFEYREK